MNVKQMVFQPFCLTILFICLLTSSLMAQMQNSSVIFSSGGGQSQSANFKQFEIIGETIIGESTSSSFSQQSGFPIDIDIVENTAPVADDISVETDENIAVEITLTGSDADGDELTFEVVDAPTNGVYEDGVYTPNVDWFGVDSFTYVANDGTVDSEIATVTITVNDVINELDTPINVAVVIDGNNLTISWDVVANANSYLLYSSSDPYATFPDNWIIVDTVTDLIYTIESVTEDKMFYCVVASTETEPAAVSKPVIVPEKEKKKFDLK